MNIFANSMEIINVKMKMTILPEAEPPPAAHVLRAVALLLTVLSRRLFIQRVFERHQALLQRVNGGLRAVSQMQLG